jgi:transposase
VTRNRLGRNVSPVWTNRRLLLRGRERLSQAALTRKWNGCVHDDPTGQILFAWIAKEAFRAMCATGHSQRAPRGPQTTDMGVLKLVG